MLFRFDHFRDGRLCHRRGGDSCNLGRCGRCRCRDRCADGGPWRLWCWRGRLGRSLLLGNVVQRRNHQL